MNILCCRINQKNVLQKEIKDCTFEVYLLTREPSSRFPMIESLKMTCAIAWQNPMHVVWIFCQMEVWIIFRGQTFCLNSVK